MKPIGFWIATWFGSGLLKGFLKIGGGTWGSIFALPLCYILLKDVSGEPLGAKFFVWGAALVVIFALGIESVPVAEGLLGERPNWRGELKRHDQSEIVIDEVWGMLITCVPLLLLEFKSYWIALGLVLLFFRIFDMVKIPPTKYFDRNPKMENAWGVMLDDGMAGIYAAICVGLIIWLFKL